MLKTDKGKLFQAISADFKIIVRKTELWEMEYCEKILHDIEYLLQNDYLSKIHLILKNISGIALRCNKYEVNYNYIITDGDRPGDNDWDDLGGKQLNIVLSYTDKWRNLSIYDKSNIVAPSLKFNWTTSYDDLIFAHLVRNDSKKFASSNLFIQRIDYK